MRRTFRNNDSRRYIGRDSSDLRNVASGITKSRCANNARTVSWIEPIFHRGRKGPEMHPLTDFEGNPLRGSGVVCAQCFAGRNVGWKRGGTEEKRNSGPPLPSDLKFDCSGASVLRKRFN